MHPVFIVRVCCVAVIAGIAVASIFFDWRVSPSVINFCLFFGASCVVFSVLRKNAFALTLACFILAFGWAHVKHDNYYTAVAAYAGRTVTGGMVMFVEPSFSSQRLTVRVETAPQQSARIYVYARRYPVYLAGDILLFSCRLQDIAPSDEVRFDRFAERRAITHACFYPPLVRSGHADSIRSRVFAVKEYARTVLIRSFHEPVSSLLLAVTIGNTRELPDDLRQSFSLSGLVHVLSVSGFHMTLIMVTLEQIGTALGAGRRTRLATVMLFIFGYLVLLGFPPAAVRAALLGSSVAFARVLGRRASGLHVLLITAACMAIRNPLIVVWDVGFQLSFLSMLGIVLFSRQLATALTSVPNFFGMRQSVAMGIAAYICIAPVLIYHYGILSLAGIVATAVVGPVFSWLLIGTLVFIGIGSVPIIGHLFQAPLVTLASYAIAVADSAARLPFSVVTFEGYSRIVATIAAAAPMMVIAVRQRIVLSHTRAR